MHFIVPLRGDSKNSLSTTLEILAKGIKKLDTLSNKKQIISISLAKSSHIENIDFKVILACIKRELIKRDLKIIVCKGIIQHLELSKRTDIIREAHCSAAGGHKVVNKTFNRIKYKFQWEHLKENIQEFIQKCVPCQLKKLVRVKTKQKMIITDHPCIPFFTVSLDIVGPLPKTKDNAEYILTMQDRFTKFLVGVPLKDQTATSVAHAFIKRFICTFGAPQAILTDQCTNFLSKLMKRVAKRFRIKQIKTTAFHPQTNGSLERSHSPLSEFLKMFTTKNSDWVELAMFNFNTGKHE